MFIEFAPVRLRINRAETNGAATSCKNDRSGSSSNSNTDTNGRKKQNTLVNRRKKRWIFMTLICVGSVILNKSTTISSQRATTAVRNEVVMI